MRAYTLLLQGATDPASPSPSRNRDAFAIAAVREAFRPRDLRLANHPNFKDRLPGNRCQRLDQIAAGVVEDLGQTAFRHWLNQAAQAENHEERLAALEIAAEIARLAGIGWEEPFGQEAA